MPGSRLLRAAAVAAAVAVGSEAGAAAPPSEPLYVKNLSPVAGLYGLPAQRNAATAPEGAWYPAVHGSVASHYVADGNSGEYLNLDGETQRFALELRYGLAEAWDVQVEVPWIDQSGGNLDDLINDWHDLWGMSDGGRSEAPNDLLDYRYQSRYENRSGSFGLQDDASGVGDVTLSLSHAFYRTEDSSLSAVLGYKFGTGDAADFTGSGEDDAFAAVRFSGAQMSDLPLYWHGQVGYLRAGDSDLPGDSQQRDLWFAGLSVDWRLAQAWSLIAQLDSHAAIMDSNIPALGDDAFLATLGARWYFHPQWSVDFSVVEDIAVETAPDVTFQASLRYYGAATVPSSSR